MAMADEDELDDDVRSLVATLQARVGLEEGQLYTLRRGLLQPIPTRDEDDTLRKIRIMDEAYQGAYALARRLRKPLRGYRPDPVLVISALVLHALRQPEASEVVQTYLKTLFDSTRVPDDPNGPSGRATG